MNCTFRAMSTTVPSSSQNSSSAFIVAYLSCSFRCPICLQRLWLIDSDLFTWTHSTRICRIHQLAVNLEISVEGRVDCLLIMVYGGIVVSVM